MTTSRDEPLATVLDDDGRVALRFRRRLPHPPEKVWRALTESEHLQHWMPCDLVGERRAGRRQLGEEIASWNRLAAALAMVLTAQRAEGGT